MASATSLSHIRLRAAFVEATRITRADQTVHSERKSNMFSPKFVYSGITITILFALTTVLLLSAPSSAQVQVPLANHVVLIVAENTSYGTVYPSGMRWLVGEGNKYGFSSNSFSNV